MVISCYNHPVPLWRELYMKYIQTLFSHVSWLVIFICLSLSFDVMNPEESMLIITSLKAFIVKFFDEHWVWDDHLFLWCFHICSCGFEKPAACARWRNGLMFWGLCKGLVWSQVSLVMWWYMSLPPSCHSFTIYMYIPVHFVTINIFYTYVSTDAFVNVFLVCIHVRNLVLLSLTSK